MTTAAAVEFRLNGKTSAVAAGTSLAELVASLGKDPRAVAIERNGDIVPRARFDAVLIEIGDALEVVQFVQGG